MKRLILCLILTAVAGDAHATASLADAITVTGATTGKVIAEATVNIASLSNAQKTALGAFVTSLGASWPGSAGNILGITLVRPANNISQISANVTGFIVHNDATTAVNQLTSGATTAIVGIVP
jgi:uncharacterized protein (UPF0333 family)